MAPLESVSLEHDVFARLPPGSLTAFASRLRFIDIGTSQPPARAGELLAKP
jgi:hypothetical protein